MINLRKTLNDAHQTLDAAGVSHALIGGFALAVYGVHRATADIDLLADGSKKDLIKKTFTDAGYSLVHESAEVLQFTGPGFIDILLANRPLSQQMLRHSLLNSTLGVYVLKPEDIIGLKIQAYTNDPSRKLQDQADIQSLLQVPGVDFGVVKKYADLFDQWPEIEKIRGITS